MIYIPQVLFVAALLSSGAAYGDAVQCAAALPPDARMIYDKVAADLKPGDVLRDVVRAHARGLVMAGKLERANAKPAAQAAGVCLKQLPQ